MATRRVPLDAERVTEANLWASLTTAGLAPTNEAELDEPSAALAAWLAAHKFDVVDLIVAAPVELWGDTSSPEILITPNGDNKNG